MVPSGSIVITGLVIALIGALFMAFIFYQRATLIKARSAKAIAHYRHKLTVADHNIQRLNTAIDERTNTQEQMTVQMRTAFHDAASLIINQTQENFMQRAEDNFNHHHEKALATDHQQSQALDQMLRPLQDSLARYEKNLTQLRAEHHQHQGTLNSQISNLARVSQDVGQEARRLATALKSGSTTAGRWGEEQLRNVVEKAGMSKYVDFQEQHTLNSDAGICRPDMIVRLPGEKHIVIDSKISLNAYLRSIDCENEAERNKLLDQHTKDLWAHVKALSKRDYLSALRQSDIGKTHYTDHLDFVILFIASESSFTAAMNVRPSLFQDAYDRKILIATPVTLMAILKSISLSWHHTTVDDQARTIVSLADTLYHHVSTLNTHFSDVGRALSTTIKRYNDAASMLDAQILPCAHKLTALETHHSDQKISAPKRVANLIHTNSDDLLPHSHI